MKKIKAVEQYDEETPLITIEEIQANLFKGESEVLVAKAEEVSKQVTTITKTYSNAQLVYIDYVCAYPSYKPTFKDEIDNWLFEFKVELYMWKRKFLSIFGINY